MEEGYALLCIREVGEQRAMGYRRTLYESNKHGCWYDAQFSHQEEISSRSPSSTRGPR
jgi:hypothetical protein